MSVGGATGGQSAGGGRRGRPRGAVRGREGKGHGKAIGSGDRAHWRPARTKVNPEGHSLVGKGKPGGDWKFMADSLQKG